MGRIKDDGDNHRLVLFFKIGFCGGFTTFSSFSLETFTLISKGNISLAVIYSFLSVISGVLFIFLGLYLSKKFWLSTKYNFFNVIF